MHVAGKSCVFCGEPIRGILDGEFCAVCGCPMHQRCVPVTPPTADPDRCDRCGAPTGLGRREARAQRRVVANLQQAMGRQDQFNGLLLVVGGTVATLGCLAITGGAATLIPTGLIGAGFALIVRGGRRIRGRDPDAEPPLHPTGPAGKLRDQ